MNLQLAMMFQDGCVLQQEKPCTIWGTADADANITVELQGQRVETKADEQGKWQVVFSGLAAADHEVLSVIDDSKRCLRIDVGIGEVWILGGQSNMEFQMRYDSNLNRELQKESFPDIRFFAYPQVSYEGQLDDFDYSGCGKWMSASHENLEYFGAVGYYFANQIIQDAKVPIGLLACNWGGTPACAWMNEEHVKKHGQVWLAEYEECLKQLGLEIVDEEQNNKNHIIDQGAESPDKDIELYSAESGIKVRDNSAYRKYIDTYRSSGYADRGNLFEDPASDRIMYPMSWEEQEQLLQMAQPMDPWIEKVCSIPGPYHQNRPCGLYHMMLEKVAPYAARGVLWYQGESDACHADIYEGVFSDLVCNWRALWKDALPFFCVQLAPFDKWFQCTGAGFPEIRRAQQQAADHMEGVYLASIADVGNEYDIHPKQKQPVGERLALLAEKYVYGKEVAADAPRFVGAEICCMGSKPGVISSSVAKSEAVSGENISEGKDERTRISVRFSHAEDGLIARGDAGTELKLFDAATGQSVDRAAYEVNICGDRLEIVIFELAAVKRSFRIAYCMTDYYEGNLFNWAELPVFPFEVIVCN